ncbi:MAG: NAD-dependent epimerase/dehydratase family protein [Burkholderiales bacterium]
MIVGSGMLARAFEPLAGRTDVLVHAAGVSNSRCTDAGAFERERRAVERSLELGKRADRLLYFSTCSVDDPVDGTTPYARHKLAMEALVARHPGHVIVRLPQVVGDTPNPHTLINYLRDRIVSGERFAVWGGARRNLIDCDDVRAIVLALLDSGASGIVANVANPEDYAVRDIVEALERATGRRASYDVVDRGGGHAIDISLIRPLIASSGVAFGPGYLDRVIGKYYA